MPADTPELLPPSATPQPRQSAHHGVTLDDEFAWLRSEQWQAVVADPELLEPPIRDYLEAENLYCDAVLAPVGELCEQVFAEMRGRIKEEDIDVPEKDGPYAYYWRYRAGEEHPVFARMPRAGGEETLLLDGHVESQHSGYFELGDCEVSPDHRLLAWSFDDTGAESYLARIRDLSSSAELPVEIRDVDSLSWATPDYLFYAQLDEEHRASRVFRHRMGQAVSEDVLVMHEHDPRFVLSVGLCRDGRRLEITSSTDDQSEVWLIDCADPEKPPVRVLERRAGHEYSIEVDDDELFVLSNREDCLDFSILISPREQAKGQSGEQLWKTLVPHRAGCLLEEMFLYRDYLVWQELEAGTPRICYVRRSSADSTEVGHGQPYKSPVQTIAFDEEAFELEMEPSPEFDATTFRFVYSSPTTPETWYEFDLDHGTREVLKTTEIPSGHNASDYRTARFSVPSTAGEMVPLTLLYHHTTALDGSAPCLLYGYGAYGSSCMPSFSANRLSLVDRGFVYAIAHVRGGEEKGRNWYLQSKGAGKQYSIDDFIACARFVGEQHLADASRIVSFGGSAGGLLVGAAVNQAPQLFAGVVAAVPFVDVLNTMLDESLPLTPGEWAQWGNPITDESAFHNIRNYSPYDQVANLDYPPMLVTGSVSDPRVGYWEPAKWVARLRARKSGDSLLLLKTEMSGGHGGQSGRFGHLEDLAVLYAFILWVTGFEV